MCRQSDSQMAFVGPEHIAAGVADLFLGVAQSHVFMPGTYHINLYFPSA
jgi:hypothetical protein